MSPYSDELLLRKRRRGPKYFQISKSSNLQINNYFMIARVSAKVKKTLAALALLSVEMVIVVSLFVVALSTFLFVARRVFVLRSTEFDFRVFTYLENYVSDRNS